MENRNVLIIAEAGVNHNGDLDLARKLIDVAADAGADIVKFQTFTAEGLVTSKAQLADYQKENFSSDQSQYEMLKKLELKSSEFIELQKYSREKNIRFLSTGFDLQSLKFLSTLEMGLWKVPSGEMTNLPYLEFMAKQKGDFILSTGMCDLKEIQDAVQIFLNQGVSRERLSVLHCSTDYPAQFHDVHLNVFKTFKSQLGLRYGYSDHTFGIEVAIAAVAMGATIIEKHFTLDRNLPGPDHKASLEPDDLAKMVAGIRNVSLALGQSEKKPSIRELKNREVARKSIVASREIQKGEIFSEMNLTTKRPGTGLSPMRWHEFLGKPAGRDYKTNELIDL